MPAGFAMTVDAELAVGAQQTVTGNNRQATAQLVGPRLPEQAD